MTITPSNFGRIRVKDVVDLDTELIVSEVDIRPLLEGQWEDFRN